MLSVTGEERYRVLLAWVPTGSNEIVVYANR
jgi:hypothetical protein